MTRSSLLLILVLLALAGCGDAGKAVQKVAPANEDVSELDWFTGHTLYELHLRGFSDTGDLRGASRELDRLVELGVANLVLVPLFPPGDAEREGELGNLYAVRDHRAIASEFGDTQLLRRFVQSAHERGLRVLLDVVLPVAAIDHVAMREHADWFLRDESGMLTQRMTRWSGIADFDFDNPDVREYLEGTLRYWLHEAGIDGFRCPLAAMAPDDFWRDLILNLRATHPGVALIAESSRPKYLEFGFNALYSPMLKERLDEARLEDMADPGHNTQIWQALTAGLRLPGRGQTTIHCIEDHFSQRSSILYTWPAVRGFAAFFMTIPGTPQMLMGQEIAVREPVTPSDRMAIAWHAGDQNYLTLYTTLTRLRERSDTLRRGDLERVATNHPDVLVYTRTLGGEMFLCAVNLSDRRPHFSLPPQLLARAWHEWLEQDFRPVPEESMRGMQALEPNGYRIWFSTDRLPGGH
jgi:alpha-amylase